MHAIINFIKTSPKRYDVFKDMVASAALDNPSLDKRELRPLCSSRWVMRLSSMESLLTYYSTVLDQLDLLQDDRSLKPEMRADSCSFLRSLESFETYYGIMVFKKMLSLTNPIHTMCQGREVRVGDIKKYVNSLVTVLNGQAFSDVYASAFYQEVKTAARDLRIDQPQPLRLQKSYRKVEGAIPRALDSYEDWRIRSNNVILRCASIYVRCLQ